MDASALPLAVDVFGQDLIDDLLPPIGGAAAALAMLGLILLLPLYVSQRREVARLLDWQERHPGAGEPEGARSGAPVAAAPTTGSMSAAAARVTSERPALARIGTAERAAIELEQAPFWRRVVERGPRHPLVISLLALLVAAAVFAAAALLLRANDDEPAGKDIVASEIEVVVLNASTAPGLAGAIANDVEDNNFIVAGTTTASATAKDSAVLYAPGAKDEGRVVARRLEIPSLLEFDSEAEAAADGAPVVVIVGEDLVKAPSGPE